MMRLVVSLIFVFSTLTVMSYPKIALYQNLSRMEDNGLQGMEKQIDDHRIANVYLPELYLFPGDTTQKNRKAIVICPGGGYGLVAFEHEGVNFALWLNKMGIAAVVLKYRMPNGHHNIPITDAQNAMLFLRKKSAAWGISPNKIGIMGFSAGGHLAATASTLFKNEKDDDTIISSKPDFSILFYPVISFEDSLVHHGSRQNLLGKNVTDKTLLHKFSPEKNITQQTPPALLFHSEDDPAVSIKNSEVYVQKLKENHIKAELVRFPTGGHGWGFYTTFPHHQKMLDILTLWLSENP